MDLKSEEMKKSLFLITFGVGLFWGLTNISGVFSVRGRILRILSPFLLGLALAFIFFVCQIKLEII